MTPTQAHEAETAAANQRKALAHLICPTCSFPKAIHHAKPCPQVKT